MSEYRLSGRASRDLLKIYIYGIENFGEKQADRYRLNLDRCFKTLADYPRMGRKSPTIPPDLRRHECLIQKGRSEINRLCGGAFAHEVHDAVLQPVRILERFWHHP